MAIENATRDQLKGVFLGTDDHGVTGVVTPLIAHDVRVIFGEQVDDFRLALVTPLGTYDNRDGHSTLLTACMRGT